MADEEDVLYESLDSHTSDEEVDEYITVSTPLPYLQPEGPYRNTPPMPSLQPGSYVTDNPSPPSYPRPDVQLRPLIQGNQPTRKPNLKPMQVPYENKGKKVVSGSRPKMTNVASPSRMPVSDYRRLEDDGHLPIPRPKPAPLPKPKFSLRSNRKKKKAIVRYIHSPQVQQEQRAEQEAHQNLTPPKPEGLHSQSECNEDDEVYYDRVLSRTKWRNILKRKKMKPTSKQPVGTPYRMEEQYKDNIVSSTHSSSSSVAKKALEYSDDEIKLKSGNPRVVCLLLSIILVALLVSIVSLAVSMVNVSQMRRFDAMIQRIQSPLLNCTTSMTSSSNNWVNRDNHANQSGLVFVSSSSLDEVSCSNQAGWQFSTFKGFCLPFLK